MLIFLGDDADAPWGMNNSSFKLLDAISHICTVAALVITFACVNTFTSFFTE